MNNLKCDVCGENVDKKKGRSQFGLNYCSSKCADSDLERHKDRPLFRDNQRKNEPLRRFDTGGSRAY